MFLFATVLCVLNMFILGTNFTVVHTAHFLDSLNGNLADKNFDIFKSTAA